MTDEQRAKLREKQQRALEQRLAALQAKRDRADQDIEGKRNVE